MANSWAPSNVGHTKSKCLALWGKQKSKIKYGLQLRVFGYTKKKIFKEIDGFIVDWNDFKTLL